MTWWFGRNPWCSNWGTHTMLNGGSETRSMAIARIHFINGQTCVFYMLGRSLRQLHLWRQQPFKGLKVTWLSTEEFNTPDTLLIPFPVWEWAVHDPNVFIYMHIDRVISYIYILNEGIFHFDPPIRSQSDPSQSINCLYRKIIWW